MRRLFTIVLGAVTALACGAYAADQAAKSLLPADSAAAFKLSARRGRLRRDVRDGGYGPAVQERAAHRSHQETAAIPSR